MRKNIKKYFLIFMVAFIFSLNTFSQENTYYFDGLSFYSSNLVQIEFENKKISIFNEEAESFCGIKNGTYDYKIIRYNSLPFIFIKTQNEEHKFLILHNDELCLLYDGEHEKPVFLGYHSRRKLEGLFYGNSLNITATSELKEGNVLYAASNLKYFKTKEPWVEAKPDYGIGEKIIIKNFAAKLYFINGFISFDKTNLYIDNSRVKKIKISFPNNKEMPSQIVELKDTANPQVIQLNYFNDESSPEIDIEILEVYEGLKYKDTCIQGILTSFY